MLLVIPKKIKYILVCSYVTLMLTYYFIKYERSDSKIHKKTAPKSRENTKMKYILLWTPKINEPLIFMGEGNKVFVDNKCKYINCYVTDDRKYLDDPRRFHAVIFASQDVIRMRANQLPKFRGINQKFIFAATESNQNYPACKPYLDGFFNWTWTYRLDSDIRFGYITGYNYDGDIIAPKPNMTWPQVEYQPIDDNIKNVIALKKKTAAWFVSNCKTRSKREDFVKILRKELMNFNLDIDVFGQCGCLICPRVPEFHVMSCQAMLKREYYFYLAFENSLSEDYVTEKVLIAFNTYTVPIVFGSADYKRFLPPNSYINALELGPKKLAETMQRIIANITLYEEYFKWKQFYYFKETTKTDSMCDLCEHINNEREYNNVSTYKNFMDWWNAKSIYC